MAISLSMLCFEGSCLSIFVYESRSGFDWPNRYSTIFGFVWKLLEFLLRNPEKVVESQTRE